jgi:transcription termination factor Rho
MTEPANQPLFEEQSEAPKKTTKRRASTTTKAHSATTKSRSRKAAVEEPEVNTVTESQMPEAIPVAGETEDKPAKGRTKTATRKKAASAAPATPAKKKSGAKKNGAGADDQPDLIREDSPVPAEKTEAPVTPVAEKPAVEAPAPAAAAPAAPTPPAATPVETSPAAAPAQPAVRRYPVYIPRTVARQLEAEGKEAPVAVTSADDLPKDLLEKIAAATTSAPQRQRHQHQPRPPREQTEQPAQAAPAAASGGELPQELLAAAPPMEGEPKPEELSEGEGLVEISGKGFGFIRDPKRNFAQAPNDIFVTPEMVKTFHLRDGQWLKGVVRRGPRGAQLHKLELINGDPAEKVKNLPAFDELTVVSPEPRITLETTPDRFTTRIVDLMCPIGRGQRALVVAPPRTGKTTFLLHIADAVKKNHPDIHLMFLLVDERPEEVTDIKRSVPGAEVFASSNDLDVKSHTRIATLAIERAKRLVEQGKHVFILLDSITRVGRAFNNAMTGGGRTGSGGLDSRALEIPRRLFAAARNTEEAGSLTIVGTTLVETNSRADEVIFQEFKGTGNMELVLDRKIAEQRVYPAIDIFMSGTRREELLIPEADLHKIHIIRRGLAGYKPLEAVERLLFFMKKFPTNAQMLAGIPG